MGDAAVGRRVKTAAAGVRELAVEAARVGADAAARAVEITDRKLAEGAGELAEVGRKATKDLDKGTRASRRELRLNSVAARDEVLARAVKMRDPGRKAAEAVAAVVGSTGDSARKRRKTVAAAKKDLTAALEEAKSAARGERGRKARWPWLVAVAVVGVGVAVVLRAKRANPLVEQDEFEGATPKEEAAARVNGHAAAPEGTPKPPSAPEKPAASPPSGATKPPVTPPKPAFGAAKPPAKPTAAPESGTKKPAASQENSPKR